MITLVWLRGTGETVFPGSPSGAFLGALPMGKFDVVIVDYPAEYAGEVSYVESCALGRTAAIQVIRGTPNLAVLGGYSAGAAIAGSLAHDIAAGEDPTLADLEITACALMADPLRPHWRAEVDEPAYRGYGILGERDVVGMPVFWAVNPGDPITCLAAGSVLRSLADFTGLVTTDPHGWVAWLQSLPVIIAQNREQHWWEHTTAVEVLAAGQELAAYLLEGEHVRSYVVDGHCRKLAQSLNAAVS